MSLLERGIYLESTVASSSGPGLGNYYHLYLVFKDGSDNPQNWKVIRGEAVNFLTDPLTIIAQQLGSIGQSIENTGDKYNVTGGTALEAVAQERYSVNVSSLFGETNEELDEAWQQLVDFALTLTNVYDYELPTTSSHTANSGAAVLTMQESVSRVCAEAKAPIGSSWDGAGCRNELRLPAADVVNLQSI